MLTDHLYSQCARSLLCWNRQLEGKQPLSRDGYGHARSESRGLVFSLQEVVRSQDGSADRYSDGRNIKSLLITLLVKEN